MKYENIEEYREIGGMVTLTADCKLGKNEIIFQGHENDLESFNRANAIVFISAMNHYVQSIELSKMYPIP